MNAKIKIYNKQTKKEKQFYLPMDIEEIEEFLNYNSGKSSGYKIVYVEDDYNFLLDINAKNDFYQDINKLVELIKDNSDYTEKETCLKLLFHIENYSNNNILISNLIDDFESIQNKYTVYDDFSKAVDWAKCNNKEYNFINTNSISDIVSNFDYDLRENYIKDMSATVDLGEELQDKLYTMDLEHILYKFQDINVLNVLDITFYLDWKKIVNKLRVSMLYIDEFKRCVIVHNGY
ncbi:MAG: hypothetical protein U9N59_12755 [Campylobacterota bacterium]|nr:hypothetical protein [Campylobacterota bacterium]